MRIFCPIALLLLFASVLCSAQHNDVHCKDLAHIVEMEQHSHALMRNAKFNALTDDYDLKYQRLEIEVDPAVNFIRGAVTSYFVPTTPGFDRIHFDFRQNMLTTATVYHGDTVPRTQDNQDILMVELSNGIAMGVLDSVTVYYEGTPQVAGFGSFIQEMHDTTPVIWTLSEPYGAKVWWPCKQNLNDKIDSTDIIIRTPAQYRAASNGVLVSEVQEGDQKTYFWKHRYPIPAYLIAIGVTNYEVFSDYVYLNNGDSIEILNYIYPESLASAEVQLKSTIEQMELYNELFGIYPFADEKYGHAQFGFGGGMEHQTMSFMGGFSYGLQAHELAHQWFGDKVTCGSWQDIWLNEGFATYLAGLTSEFLGPPQSWYNWKSGRIDAVVSQPGGSVWVNDTSTVNRIFNGRLSYSKGAMLLHMLRWKLGDADFFQGVRNYLDDPDIAFGYARTTDLAGHLEEQSGLDLTEFFDDWFYGQGYPSYQLMWSDLGDSVVINLGQTTSHPSVEFFEMPVPVLVMGDGQDSLLVLDHLVNGQEFTVSLPFSVDSVVIDPDLWLISAANTVEELLVGTREPLLSRTSIDLFPNPFTETVSIGLDSRLQAETIEIFDIHGKHMVMRDARSVPETFETGSWAAGLYLVKVRTATGVAIGQMIKL